MRTSKAVEAAEQALIESDRLLLRLFKLEISYGEYILAYAKLKATVNVKNS